MPPPIFPVVMIQKPWRFIHVGWANSWREAVFKDGRKVNVGPFRPIRSACGRVWLTEYPFYSWT